MSQADVDARTARSSSTAARISASLPLGALWFSVTLAACTAVFAFCTWQVLTYGWLVAIDTAVQQSSVHTWAPEARVWVNVVVDLGLRGAMVPPVTLLIAWRAYKLRQSRPILVFLLAQFCLNASVGFTKIVTGRSSTWTGDPSVFIPGGMAYPSGHAANTVVTWGLLAYVFAYKTAHKRVLTAVVTTAALAVGACTIYLDTHWVSDLFAGWAVGLAIVLCAIALDRLVTCGALPWLSGAAAAVDRKFARLGRVLLRR